MRRTLFCAILGFLVTLVAAEAHSLGTNQLGDDEVTQLKAEIERLKAENVALKSQVEQLKREKAGMSAADDRKPIDAPRAVEIAERFVRENGYTDFVPQDASKLTAESFERSERGEWIARRHNKLRPRALGYMARGKDSKRGWTVGFEPVSPSANAGTGRAVTMDEYGEGLTVQHKDLILKNLKPRPK